MPALETLESFLPSIRAGSETTSLKDLEMLCWPGLKLHSFPQPSGLWEEVKELAGKLHMPPNQEAEPPRRR